VKLLPRDACFDVLSLGDFCLHEQREVTRSPDASGNEQDARINNPAQGRPTASGTFAKRHGSLALYVTRSPYANGNAQDTAQAKWQLCFASRTVVTSGLFR
jgi:hypothetical protein